MRKLSTNKTIARRVKELTEEDCEVLGLLHHGLQHGPSDELDVALHLHLSQPVQDLLLHPQVALVQVGHAVLEEDQGRVGVHSDLLGEGGVGCF